MTANPVELIGGITTTANVPKADVVAWAKSRVIQVFADVTEVRNTVLAAQIAVFVRTFNRMFLLDNADTTTADDGGITCIISSDGKRFKPFPLLNVAEVNVRDYGAVGDGTTDDGAAFATALAIGVPVRVPYTSAGYNLGSTARDLPANSTIRGDNWVKLKSTSTTYLFGINSNVTVEGFSIDMTGSGSSSSALCYLTASQNVQGTRISRLRFSNCVSAITDQTSAAKYVFDLQWRDIQCTLTRGPQFVSTRSRGFFLLDGCLVDHTANTSAVTWSGFHLSDFIGAEFNRCDVQGPTTAGTSSVYQSTAIGFYLQGAAGSASLWMDRCETDTTMGPGFDISSVTYCDTKDVKAINPLGTGIALTSVTNGTWVNTTVIGSRTVTGVLSTQDGISLSGCGALQFANLSSQFNNRDGVSISGNTGSCTFSAVDCRLNGRWGWLEADTCNENLKNGGLFISNNQIGSGGSITQVGSVSVFANYIPQSGAFVQYTQGAAVVT